MPTKRENASKPPADAPMAATKNGGVGVGLLSPLLPLLIGSCERLDESLTWPASGVPEHAAAKSRLLIHGPVSAENGLGRVLQLI